jgi:hypothetical protein
MRPVGEGDRFARRGSVIEIDGEIERDGEWIAGLDLSQMNFNTLSAVD